MLKNLQSFRAPCARKQSRWGGENQKELKGTLTMLQGRFEVVQISAGAGTDVHQGFRDTVWKKKPPIFYLFIFLKERVRNLLSSRGEPALQPLSHPGPRKARLQPHTALRTGRLQRWQLLRNLASICISSASCSC